MAPSGSPETMHQSSVVNFGADWNLVVSLDVFADAIGLTAATDFALAASALAIAGQRLQQRCR